MLDFTFFNPTRIHFGKGQIAKINEEIPQTARVLILSGGGSIKRNGTYDEVISALGKRAIFEFWGIEPNPTYETALSAIASARKEQVTFLLAVGGGSVLDATKFIAAAIPFKGDPWDIVSKAAPVREALPLGAVQTLPATGSEMNALLVLSRKETHDKLPARSPLFSPRFSVLDPTKTYSPPPRQVANGIIDAFVHVLEQYVTYPVDAPIQDRYAEAILLTLLENGPKALATPENYDVRANVMWAATMALNSLIGVGVPADWSVHAIGHELTERHGIDHARTLAVILPAMWTIMRQEKRVKLAQYGRRVLGLSGDDETISRQAITQTTTFFESLGVPTQLRAYGIDKDAIPPLLNQLRRHLSDQSGSFTIGERQTVTIEIVSTVLEAAL